MGKLNAAITRNNVWQNRHMFQLSPVAIVAIPELSASLAPTTRKTILNDDQPVVT